MLKQIDFTKSVFLRLFPIIETICPKFGQKYWLLKNEKKSTSCYVDTRRLKTSLLKFINCINSINSVRAVRVKLIYYS